MLRVTVHDNPVSLTLQLEGTLVGPWVHEASESWRHMRNTRRDRPVCVNLAGVTSIDAGGKEFLSVMHAEGAELIARGCLMRAIVAGITRASIPGCGPW